MCAPIHAPALETAQGQVAILEESRHLVSEPIAPPKLSDVVDIASYATPDAKSVPDKVVPLNLKSQTRFPSAGPQHTAENPNWALAPEDPPKPRTTLRKKGERGHGVRRGKQPYRDSSPESIPPKSSKVSYSNRRRSKPSSPRIIHASPTQKAMGLNAEKYSPTLGGNSSKSKNLPYLPMFRVTEGKLSPSGKQDFKDGPPVLETERQTPNANSFYGLQGTLLEPVRESSLHQSSSPRLTQGSPASVDLEKRSRSSSVSINAFEKSDKHASRRSPPWKRKSALLTIVESAPKIVNAGFGKGPSMTLYRSSPPSEATKLKGAAMGEKKGSATEATKDTDRVVTETAISESYASNKPSKPDGSPQDHVRRFQPDSTLARGVRKVGRVSCPSSEEDLKLHKTAQEREPLPWRSKANNQAFSRPYIPPIPSAPLPPPRPNQSTATDVEVDSLNSSKETLHLGTQTNSFHAEGRARVNLPSKLMDMQPDPQTPATSLGTDSIRPPYFSSNIPIPTRTQNRSGSIQDGPNFQAQVNAMGISGLETPERTYAPPGGLALTHRPKLPRPGHIYRSASQTFIRQPEFQVGNSVPNPSPNTYQESHGLQYYSLAGYQPTPAIILPMPNDTPRPPVPPIPRSRPDYPFPDLAHVHSYQVNRACPQGPETTYTGITQPPTTAPVGRLHRSTSLYGGWRERHGLGGQQVSGITNIQLHSHNANDTAAILAPRGFPNALQRNGNA